MKRNSQWIIACTVLWLSACSTLPSPVGPDTEERRQAAVQTRWIGVPKIWTGKCPATHTSDWSVSSLVSLNELEQSVARSVQKVGLDRFCVYEYKGTGRVTRDLMPPRKILAQLRSAEPDRLALSSMGNDLEGVTSDPFYKRFREQVQIWNLPAGATGRVRLVFLDTQPTGEGIPQWPNDPNLAPRSRHGYTLAHIAGHLAGYSTCGSDCTVQIASRLALPVVRFNPGNGEVKETNETSGGFRGTFTDLAQAIIGEISHWKNMHPATRPSRLVLNLSVGWDGEKYGGWIKQQLDLEVQNAKQNGAVLTGPSAVYSALKVAAEQHVLVIAAAGNDRGGLNPTVQPLLPGGWEKWDWEQGNPLIYAASGVDGLGHQLVNTRRQGEAPRVAYADHVFVPDLNPNSQHTATLTGTSIASAVISTIAAIVWSYQTTDLPPAVMNKLDASGTDTISRTPDFFAPANTGQVQVQQITLCRALEASPDTVCGATPLAPTPINLSLTFQPQVDLDPLFTPEPTEFRPHRDTQDQALCGPQPGVNPCPNCVVDPPNMHFRLASTGIEAVADTLYENTTLTNDYRVLVELPDPEWGVLKEATLEIFEVGPSGKRETLPDINSISLPEQGNTMEVTFSAPTGSFQAALTFALAPNATASEESYMSVVNPLFVDVPDI